MVHYSSWYDDAHLAKLLAFNVLPAHYVSFWGSNQQTMSSMLILCRLHHSKALVLLIMWWVQYNYIILRKQPANHVLPAHPVLIRWVLSDPWGPGAPPVPPCTVVRGFTPTVKPLPPLSLPTAGFKYRIRGFRESAHGFSFISMYLN